MDDEKEIKPSKRIFVIPVSTLGQQPYFSTMRHMTEVLHVSEKQIQHAIDTGHVLKQHFFDEE